VTAVADDGSWSVVKPKLQNSSEWTWQINIHFSFSSIMWSDKFCSGAVSEIISPVTVLRKFFRHSQ